MYFKDLQNNFHSIDSAELIYILPQGCIGITDEEYAQSIATQQAAHAALNNILDQIIVLEQSITPRRIRESIATGDITFITDVDSKIAALRLQLPVA